MSGKKLTDVLERVSFLSNRCTQERKILDENFAAKAPTITRISAPPKVDIDAIDACFNRAGSNLADERSERVQKAQNAAKAYSELTVEADNMSKKPDKILQKLRIFDQKIRDQESMHYMDNEYKHACSLGVELDEWVNSARALIDQRRQIEIELKDATSLKQILAQFDKQLLDLDSAAKEQKQQENMQRIVSEYQTDCKQIINMIDSKFLRDFLPEDHAILNDLECELEAANTIALLKSLIKKINSYSIDVTKKKHSMLEKQTQLTEALAVLEDRFFGIQMRNPVSQENMDVDSFFSEFGVDRLQVKTDLHDKLSNARCDAEKMHLMQTENELGTLESNLLAFEAQCRDDQLKCDEMVATALTLRTQLLDSGVVGAKSIDSEVHQMLAQGIKIKTCTPRGAYFHFSPDGGIESDIDVLSADCVKTMSDINAALVKQGFMPNPRNYSVPKEQSVQKLHGHGAGKQDEEKNRG